MVDEGVRDASRPFGDDNLVNLSFSFTRKGRSFKDERFEDILDKKDGFHELNDADFSSDNNDVGMNCWKQVEEPIHDSFSKGSLNFVRPTFENPRDLV